MSSHSVSPDEKLSRFMKQYGIEGTVSKGGPRGRLYEPSARVFTAEVRCEGRQDTFAVYTGTLHPDIDFLFAFRWLLDTASQAEDESYERWTKENMSYYEHEMDEERAKLLYEEEHDVFQRLLAVLSEEIYRACSEAIR